MFQFIEKDSPVKLYYSPGRDLAHCGMPYIGLAVEQLLYQLDNGKSSFLSSLMERLEVNDSQLRDGIDKFVLSLKEEVSSGTEDLLRENSFASVPDPVKAIIYTYISPVFIGTSIRAYKDVNDLTFVRELDVDNFKSRALHLVNKYSPDTKGFKIDFGKIMRQLREAMSQLKDKIRTIMKLG